MSGAGQALVSDTGDASGLRKALADAIPKGPHPNPHAEWVTVRLDVVTGAIDHLEWLENGNEEWRLMARAAQAQVKRKDVTLEHASAVVRSVQPNLSTTSRAWAQLVEECSYWLSAERAHMAGAATAALRPSDDFPEDYEV